MPDPTTLAASYLAAWAPGTPEERTTILSSALAPTVRYTDPDDDVHGIGALIAVIERVTAPLPPGYRFALVGPVLAHHDQVSFAWSLGTSNETSPTSTTGTASATWATGRDVLSLNQAGRSIRVVGFFDPTPAIAP